MSKKGNIFSYTHFVSIILYNIYNWCTNIYFLKGEKKYLHLNMKVDVNILLSSMSASFNYYFLDKHESFNLVTFKLMSSTIHKWGQFEQLLSYSYLFTQK